MELGEEEPAAPILRQAVAAASCGARVSIASRSLFCYMSCLLAWVKLLMHCEVDLISSVGSLLLKWLSIRLMMQLSMNTTLHKYLDCQSASFDAKGPQRAYSLVPLLLPCW